MVGDDEVIGDTESLSLSVFCAQGQFEKSEPHFSNMPRGRINVWMDLERLTKKRRYPRMCRYTSAKRGDVRS
jgi:hypothetical protein